jgi:DNA mismatch repair protein MutL
MPTIKVLPDEISQKIAAGEVVERPFSVVKELVENSLDAGATEVRIELHQGGKSLIRVSDNGVGMTPKDVLVSFERHSTSKISNENDLLSISTLGFRGEALPSISAVSRIVMKTSSGSSATGTRVEREGENLISATDIPFPRGTSVEVRDLFFNLPARKKFLRSERSELNQITKYLVQVSIAFVGVGFFLSHGKRDIFGYPAVSSLEERLYQIYGKSLLDRLIQVKYSEDSGSLSGFSSRPPSGRRDRNRQFIFVNRRLVKEKTCQAALNQAYKGFLEKDQFAEAFLFLGIPPNEVDVNVHPAKTEVRFLDSQAVFHLVRRGLESAILKEMGVKEVAPAPERPGPQFEVKEPYQIPFIKEKQPEGKDATEFLTLDEREGGAYPHVLGQYLNLYIVVADEEGLFIIDQHNAHERVLYDKYTEIDQGDAWPSKLTLFPQLFDLSPSQILSLEDNRSLLEEIGFVVDAAGGQTYSLKEFPDIFAEEEAKDIFLSLLDELNEETIKDKKSKLLATVACKTAIKAGHPLSSAKMNYLVEELMKTSNPSLCPHGRPITLKIDRTTIEKTLKRSS